MTIQKPDSFELFYRYLNGNATKEENELINYWIVKDEGFSQKIEEYRILFSGLSELRIKELVRQLPATVVTEDSSLELDDVEVVERYLNGQLKGEALETFEYRLHTDPVFKEQVNQYQTVFDGLSQLRKGALEKKLESATTVTQETASPTIDIRPKRKTEQPTTGTIRKMLPLIAAAAALVFLLVSLPFLSESETDKFQRLQAEYNDAPKIENLMSAGTRADSMMRTGISHYRNADYAAARDHFKHTPTSEETQLYIAHTYFKQDQPSMASGFYKALVFSKNTDIRDEAQWFWVLCNLKGLPATHDDLVKGLRIIVNTGGAHKYKEQATKLLADL